MFPVLSEDIRQLVIKNFERQKKNAQKVWSKDLVHEKTFRLSSSNKYQVIRDH